MTNRGADRAGTSHHGGEDGGEDRGGDGDSDGIDDGETAALGRAGVILAGGRSRRFGDDDKALADLAGVPMLRRVADRLAPVTDEIVVNCRADQRPEIDAIVADFPWPATVAVDEEPDLGPMAGIATGLAATDAPYAAVVACDMPFVDPDFVAYCFERAAGHDGAVPRRDDGWYQTTQAVYRTEPMRAACERALDRAERKILSALSPLEYVVVSEAEIDRHASPRTFENCNTREEFDAAVDHFRREGR